MTDDRSLLEFLPCYSSYQPFRDANLFGLMAADPKRDDRSLGEVSEKERKGRRKRRIHWCTRRETAARCVLSAFRHFRWWQVDSSSPPITENPTSKTRLRALKVRNWCQSHGAAVTKGDVQPLTPRFRAHFTSRR